jgi:polyisoprenoid-binding protein YceI
MKKITSVLMFTGALFVLNVQRPPVADKALIGAAKEVATEKGKDYKVDATASTLGWTGTKPSGKHNGTIKITDGKVTAKKNALVGGSFTLDMTSIACTDLEGKGKEGLEGHLKSPDFFDVAKYATAKFVVTGITPIAAGQNVLLAGATHNISGNLTLKGVSKSVTFPAEVKMEDKKLSAIADFNIDRTEWGISYGADGKVAKEINLKLNLVANK